MPLTHITGGQGCPRPSPRCYVWDDEQVSVWERQLGQCAGNGGQLEVVRNYQIYLRELSGKCILNSVSCFLLFSLSVTKLKRILLVSYFDYICT